MFGFLSSLWGEGGFSFFFPCFEKHRLYSVTAGQRLQKGFWASSPWRNGLSVMSWTGCSYAASSPSLLGTRAWLARKLPTLSRGLVNGVWGGAKRTFNGHVPCGCRPGLLGQADPDLRGGRGALRGVRDAWGSGQGREMGENRGKKELHATAGPSKCKERSGRGSVDLNKLCASQGGAWRLAVPTAEVTEASCCLEK